MSNGPARLVTSRVIRSSVRGVDKNTSINAENWASSVEGSIGVPLRGLGASNGDVVIEDDVTKSLSTKQLVAPQSTQNTREDSTRCVCSCEPTLKGESIVRLDGEYRFSQHANDLGRSRE